MRKLDCFEPCSVQLGDKAYYTLRPSDLVVPVKLKKSQSPLDVILGDKGDGASVTEGDEEGSIAAPEQVAVTLEDIKKPPLSPTLKDTLPMDVSKQGLVLNGVAEQAQHNGQDAVEDGDADDSEYEDEDECFSDTGSSASARSNTSQNSNSSHKKKKGKGLQTKLLKKKKLRKARSRYNGGRGREMRPGDRIPVEIIFTFSSIEVMWQVGKNYTEIRWYILSNIKLHQKDIFYIF